MNNMKLNSVNVGRPRDVVWRGRRISSGIFKKAISGAVMVHALNVEGDRQADLEVHGGFDKAVYAYPHEHYPYWQALYPEMEMPAGVFGENFTVEGMLETEVCIGDLYQVGKTTLVVTEPRIPCYKLAIRWGQTDIIEKFLASRRTGFYFAVLREGKVTAGDQITLLYRPEVVISVADIIRVFAHEKEDVETLRQAITLKALPQRWRDYFQRQLELKTGEPLLEPPLDRSVLAHN